MLTLAVTTCLIIALVAHRIFVSLPLGRRIVRISALPSIRKIKSLTPILITLAVLTAATAFTFSTHRMAVDTITMPLRVTTTQSAEVTLEVSDGSAVTSMYLKAHQIGYHWTDGAMVEYRINGSDTWTGIDNSVASCYQPENQRGCIGGQYHTIRFTVPASDVVTGSNTIQFRWTSSKEVVNFGGSGSSDYTTAVRSVARILEIDLQDDSGNSYVENDFSMDDPSQFSAPSTGDASNGRTLWENAVLEESNISGSPQLEANCADCHAADGYDLQYFGYHNESIINRAKFHGLTDQEGKDIAAFIRSEHSFAPPARPWTPLYQPGPSIDESKPELWAAGAGLDAVLDKDSEMKPYLFPNGTNDWQRYSTDNNLNVRKIPIALQLPDWNNWLPDVHPFDAVGESNFKDGADNTSWGNAWGEYQELISAARETPLNLDPRQGLPKEIKQLGQDVLYARYDESGWASSYPLLSIQLYSLHQWGMVKQWEVLHGVGHSHGNLQDLPSRVYPEETLSDSRLAVNGTKPAGDILGWIGKNKQAFNIAPHISGPNQYQGKGPFQNGSENVFFSTAWYELQTILNTGYRDEYAVFAQTPMDWKYHFSHIGNDSEDHSLPQPYRYVKGQIKMMQSLDNVNGVENKNGWYERHLTPEKMFWSRNGERTAVFGSLPNSTYRNIAEGVLRAWIATTKQFDLNSTPSKTAWNRGTNANDNELLPESYEPTNDSYFGNAQDHADNIYRLMFDAAELGVSAYTLDKIARWSEKAWPNGNWEQWMSDGSGDDGSTTNASPSVSITSPTDGATFSAPATISLSADASDSDGSVASVTFYSGNTKIGEATSSPYEATWSDVAAGTYTLTAEATDDDGATTTSASISVTASASLTENNGLSYSYYEGDWSQLPDFGNLTAVSTGTTSDISTTVRERDNLFGLRFVGYVEISSSDTGTYTFYTTSDDGSRLLVNGQEIVSNDGIHAPEEASGSVDLSAGWHKITVEYFEQEGGEELSASWKGPSLSKQEIPPSRLYLSPETSQEVTLNAGWNLISSRLAPSDNTISTLFSTVESELVVVQNQQGDSYDPTDDTNSLTTWDSSQGYRVYMSGSQTLSISGSSMASNTLSLDAGWNLIPFYPSSEMAVEDALSAISNELEIVKDETGNSYIPARGLNEIGTLKPGRAYKVYVSTSTSFTYP
jgi:hypothetical protein